MTPRARCGPPERFDYEQIIGVPPGRLLPSRPIDRLLPVAREQALAVARRENPAVLGATYDIDVAQYAIRIAESALYPTITPQGYLLNTQNTDVNLGVKASNDRQSQRPDLRWRPGRGAGAAGQRSARADAHRARPGAHPDGGGRGRRLGDA